MAQDALEAAETPVAEPLSLEENGPSRPPAPPRAPARPPERRAASRFGARQGLAMLAILVVAGIALVMIRPEPDNQYRSGDTPEPEDYAIEVTTPALQFSWNEVPEAYYYSLVIMDVTTADVVDAVRRRGPSPRPAVADACPSDPSPNARCSAPSAPPRAPP